MSEPTLIETIIIGDTHADFDGYRQMIADAEQAHGRTLPSIHVGDYGFGWFAPQEERAVEAFHRRNPRHRFIRGNHDDPATIKVAPGYLLDGSISASVLFIGGAAGAIKDWETELTTDQMMAILASLKAMVKKPTVIISHEAPLEAAGPLCANLARSLRPCRTKSFLSEVLTLVKPYLWLFGHWHHPWSADIGGTHFRALGYNESFTMPLPWQPNAFIEKA